MKLLNILANNTFLTIAIFLTFASLSHPPISFAAEDWSEPIDISQSSVNLVTPSITSGTNVVYAAWHTPGGGGSGANVFFTKRSGNSWTTPSIINPGTIGPRAFITDVEGNLHLSYHGLDSPFLAYYRFNNGNNWTDSVPLSEEFIGNVQWVSITTDLSNNPHVVWPSTTAINKAIVYYSKKAGSGWTPPQALTPSNTFSYLPRIAVDNSGAVHVVWLDFNSRRIYYRKLEEGLWSESVALSPPSTPTGDPDITVDNNGNAHVVWVNATKNADIYYTSQNSTDWSVPENVSLTDKSAGFPSIDTDTENNLHLVWSNLFGGNSEILYKKKEGDSWSIDPINISRNLSDSGHPNISVDSNGGLHVVWLDLLDNPGSPAHVFYSTLAPEGKKLGVKLIKSIDPEWKNEPYDHTDIFNPGCGTTIGACGCALTSVVMVLRYHGITIGPNGEETNPVTLNEYLSQIDNPQQSIITCKKTLPSGEVTYHEGRLSRGYKCGGVIWPTAAKYSKDATDYRINILGEKNPPMIKWDEDESYIYKHDPDLYHQQILDNNPLIIRVEPPDPHWVVLTGYTPDDFLVNDPGFPRDTLSEFKDKTSKAYVRYYKKVTDEKPEIAISQADSKEATSDFSGLLVATSNPDQILVTDPSGNQAGFNPETSTNIYDVPGSSYFFDPAIADDTGVNPPPHPDTGNNMLYINLPEEGSYNVKIIPGSDGPYGYAVYAYDRDANLTLNGFEDEAATGNEKEYKFEYNPEPGETTLALEIPIDILPFLRKNIIFHKRNYLIPVAILSTPNFDATSGLDETSLTFGRIGDETSLFRCIRPGIDVNRDGLKDNICLFRSRTADFQADNTQGVLKGQTSNGTYIKGSDSIIPWPKF